MEILNATSRKRETYEVILECSLLWECVLGIAAITNKPLIDTLERDAAYWTKTTSILSQEMFEQLAFVESHNTWKALLQLLHQQKFKELPEFLDYIQNLSSHKLIYICIPYLGSKYQVLRNLAARHNEESIQKLVELTKDHLFFSSYIDYICHADPEELKIHLTTVMKGYYEAVIKPESDYLFPILERDFESKRKMKEKMSSEELVEWATGGVTYLPEPSVYQVLLIPQYNYRPWNIEGDIEGTKVFFYPISHESIDPEDKYKPSNLLVSKYKALGDEVRLRIIKMLYEGELSLQELTDRLQMGKSTVHHHLKILRAAKLVEICQLKYRLKRKTILSLEKELQGYLHNR